jgi:hypothetical protein
MEPKEMKKAVKKVLRRIQQGIGDHPANETASPTVGKRRISKYEIEKFLGECLLPFLDDMSDVWEHLESDHPAGGS